MKPFKFIPNIQPLLRFGLAFLAAGWVAAGIAPDSMGQGGDALREADREFERMERTIDAEFENIDREWEALVREQREEWERLRREIEALWDSYVPSNRVRWVDHSGSKEARSQVDFEKGEVTVGALAKAGQSGGSGERLAGGRRDIRGAIVPPHGEGGRVAPEMLSPHSIGAAVKRY
ncbi:MAG: hypothetical protein VCF07_05265, partial [Nitrospinota bacterium]